MSDSSPIDTLLEKYKDILHPQVGGRSVRSGWSTILQKMFAIIHFHIGNWSKMRRIKDSADMRGEIPPSSVVEYLNANPTDPLGNFKVTQIKNKFGTLRFYVEHEDDFIRGVIAMGEAIADVTCDRCGNLKTEKHVC